MFVIDLKALWFVQALVECEGDSIDLSGDIGAVGRIVIPDTPAGNSEMYLDLKGIFHFDMIYVSTIVLFLVFSSIHLFL